jgi:hypothetical protein
MTLTYQRIDPTGALYGSAISATPATISYVHKTTKQIAPIPSDNPVCIPLGSIGQQITLQWYIRSASDFLELRKWNPNFYLKATASTHTYDIPVDSIWAVDELRVGRKANEPGRWIASLTMTREWNWEADLVSPTPPELAAPSVRTDSVIGVYLSNVDVSGEYVDIGVQDITFEYKSSKQDIAIPGENHIGIPLGYEGPTITLNGIVKGTDLVGATGWTGNTVLKCEKTSYTEFDIDAPTTNYSRWIIESIGWRRAVASAATGALGSQEWQLSLVLVRYWGQELVGTL